MLEALAEILIKVIEGGLKGREALAVELEQLAARVRAGELIPDAAFEQAVRDRTRFELLRDMVMRNLRRKRR